LFVFLSNSNSRNFDHFVRLLQNLYSHGRLVISSYPCQSVGLSVRLVLYQQRNSNPTTLFIALRVWLCYRRGNLNDRLCAERRAGRYNLGLQSTSLPTHSDYRKSSWSFAEIATYSAAS